jgi:DnaJ-class molecular chaperone
MMSYACRGCGGSTKRPITIRTPGGSVFWWCRTCFDAARNGIKKSLCSTCKGKGTVNYRQKGKRGGWSSTQCGMCRGSGRERKQHVEKP